MKIFFGFVSFLMVSSAFAASPLQFETEGMAIKLSWSVAEYSEGEAGPMHSNGDKADPLQIDVWTDAHSKLASDGTRVQDRVRAVISNHCISHYYGTVINEIHYADLRYVDSNHYTGEVTGGVKINITSYYEGFKCHQEMALVKEGAWFKQPNSGKNFEFELTK